MATDEAPTVSEPAPIPRAQFHEAIASLSTEAFATFVGDLWAETAASVTVDPPFVVVHAADGCVTRLKTIASATTEHEDFASDETNGITADVVVVAHRDAVDHLDDEMAATANTPARSDAAADASDPDGTPSGDQEHRQVVYTPNDLRNRLLYERTPARGERLCVDALGVSLRSTAYPTVAPTRSEDAVSGLTGNDDGPTAARDETDSQTCSVDTTDDPSSDPEWEGAPGPGTSEAEATATGPTKHVDRRNALRGSNGRTTWRPVAVAAIAVVMLAAVGGAATLVTDYGVSEFDDIGDFGDFGNGGAPDERDGDGASNDDLSTDPPDVATGEGGATGERDSPPHYYADGIGSNGSADRVTAGGAELSGNTVATRSTTLEPTCDRPPLLVVQIQMNALRQNDPTTNDGIRTTRRFASPGNRRAVGSFARFVDLFQTPTYDPMLSYDSAEYAPERVNGDVAEIRVVTRENGTVTATYTFRLRQIGAEDGSITGGSAGYSGCWMTDSVVASEPARTE
jgi:hypothetical protein